MRNVSEDLFVAHYSNVIGLSRYTTRVGGIYVESTRFSSHLAIAHDKMIIDGVEYTCFILLQKLPLTSRYVVRESQILDAKDDRVEIVFGAIRFNVFWIASLSFKLHNATVSAMILPDFNHNLSFFTASICWILVGYDMLKRRKIV